MNKKIILLLIFVFFIITACKYNRIYSNNKMRYNIKYPSGWIALNSNHDKKKEIEFKEKLIKESIITNYDSVDVGFYNPDSTGPIFQQITVKSEQARFNVNKINQNIKSIEDFFMEQLTGKYDDVRQIKVDMIDFKKGKIFSFEYSFNYSGTKYFSKYIIIPGKLYGTFFITGICKIDEVDGFMIIFNNVLNSFRKY